MRGLEKTASLTLPLNKGFMSGAKGLDGFPFRQAWPQGFDLVNGNIGPDLFQIIRGVSAATDSHAIELWAVSLGFQILSEPLLQILYPLGMIQQGLIEKYPFPFFFQVM